MKILTSKIVLKKYKNAIQLWDAFFSLSFVRGKKLGSNDVSVIA